MVAGVGEPVVFIHGAFIADAFGPLLHEPDLARSYQLLNVSPPRLRRLQPWLWLFRTWCIRSR